MADQFLKTLDIAALTDIGLKRQRNEDSNRLVIPPAGSPQERWGALFMVADGMGGLGGGDVASQAAITEVFFRYYDVNNTEEDIQTRLLNVLEAASGVVRDQAPKLNLPRIGSTAAGIVLLPSGKMLVFNIGDCRVYRIRDRKIQRISHDQSIMETRIELGMSPEEAARSSNSSMVTAFLGQPLPIKPFFVEEQAQENDVYLMCSDGLWSLVEAPEILKIVQSNPAEMAAKKLINLALKRGGSDNVTTVIARIGKPPSPTMGLLPLALAAIALIVVLGLGWYFLSRPNASAGSGVTPTASQTSLAAGSTATGSTSVAVQVLPTLTITPTLTIEPPTETASSTASAASTEAATMAATIAATLDESISIATSQVALAPSEVSTMAATEALSGYTATPAPLATEAALPVASDTPTDSIASTEAAVSTETPLRGKPYIVLQDVEGLRCPEADCKFAVKLTKGSIWYVTDEIQGGLIQGNTSKLWYKVAYKNESIYVHSSYLAPAEPF